MKKVTPVRLEEEVSRLAKSAASLERESLPEFVNRVVLREARDVLQRYHEKTERADEPKPKLRPKGAK